MFYQYPVGGAQREAGTYISSARVVTFLPHSPNLVIIVFLSFKILFLLNIPSCPSTSRFGLHTQILTLCLSISLHFEYLELGLPESFIMTSNHQPSESNSLGPMYQALGSFSVSDTAQQPSGGNTPSTETLLAHQNASNDAIQDEVRKVNDKFVTHIRAIQGLESLFDKIDKRTKSIRTKTELIENAIDDQQHDVNTIHQEVQGLHNSTKSIIKDEVETANSQLAVGIVQETNRLDGKINALANGIDNKLNVLGNALGEKFDDIDRKINILGGAVDGGLSGLKRGELKTLFEGQQELASSIRGILDRMAPAAPPPPPPSTDPSQIRIFISWKILEAGVLVARVRDTLRASACRSLSALYQRADEILRPQMWSFLEGSGLLREPDLLTAELVLKPGDLRLGTTEADARLYATWHNELTERCQGDVEARFETRGLLRQQEKKKRKAKVEEKEEEEGKGEEVKRQKKREEEEGAEEAAKA